MDSNLGRCCDVTVLNVINVTQSACKGLNFIHLAVHVEKLVQMIKCGRCSVTRWRVFTTDDVRIRWHWLRVIYNHAFTFHEFLYEE